MNCPECLEQLQTFLDGSAIPEREGLQAHLAGCAPCREWFAAALLLREGLRGQSHPPVPVQLTGRILAAVAGQRRRARLRRWSLAGLAAAAAILIAVLMSRPGPQQSFPEPAPEAKLPAPKQHAQPPAELGSPSAASLGQSVREARSAVASLTSGLTAKTREAQRLWSAALDQRSAPGLSVIGELEQPLQPAAQSLRESGRGVSVSLAAVTDSARRAVNYFLRELPPLRAERKTGL
jgi:hypothetical protein